MSDPVLRAPDFDKPFLVTTDASERGMGAVLMQEGPNQEFHPVMFLSKKLSERESHWSISEKECYAIVYALELKFSTGLLCYLTQDLEGQKVYLKGWCSGANYP
ncbi:unnamed protein product [Lepidochelys kempii]